MDPNTINLSEIEIAPFRKGMTKGVFDTYDEEFKHLIKWFKDLALLSQRDKKSKTYVAIYKDKIIGYISISAHHLEAIPGIIPFTKSFEFQVLSVGKLYLDPSMRGQGVGRRLMDFALDIAQVIDEMIGCVGILVDANNKEDTIAFYTNYGFEVLSKNRDNTTQMFFKLPEESILNK